MDRRNGFEVVPADLPEATDAAMRYLAPCARSCWEVRRHLVAKGFDEKVSAAAEARLVELGILDDREFARGAVEFAVLRRHEAPAKVELALLARGVPRDFVADALAEILMDEGNVEGAIALAAVRLRTLHGPPLVVRRRLTAYLARRGYDAEVASAACANLLGSGEMNEIDDMAANAGPWSS